MTVKVYSKIFIRHVFQKGSFIFEPHDTFGVSHFYAFMIIFIHIFHVVSKYFIIFSILLVSSVFNRNCTVKIFMINEGSLIFSVMIT